MILNDGTDWQPDDEDVVKWQQLYPAVDIFQELNKMDGWLDANPTKRKTARGIKRFVNSWLSRAQDKGGSSPVPESGGLILKSKQMSNLDDLTQVLTGQQWERDMYIEKYGQYFEDGVRHTK